MVLQKLASTIFNSNAKRALSQYNQASEEQQENQEEEEEYSGKLCVEYSCGSGQLAVSADIIDISEMSAELLSRTCFQIESGAIIEYVYQALSAWCEEDPQRLLFIEMVGRRLQELRKSEEVKKLAIDPSVVFNLRKLKQQ